jgi:L-ribulose-5-phosphate 3-epimerase
VKAGVMNAVVGGGDAEAFRRARRVGFEGLELDLSRDALMSSERLDAARAERAATGVAVPSLVLGEHSDRGGIADTDAAVAGSARADVERALEWAAALGAGAILLPFFGRAELASENDLDRAARAFRPLCDAAAERGVTLSYEGTLPAGAIRALAARVQSRAFGCYFDLANAVVRGYDSATEIRELGDLVRRVHFKDARVKTGDCEPGQGLVDFGAGADALREIGYDGWLVLETPPAPLELVARDLSFARTVFPGLAASGDWPRLGIFSYDFGRGEWDALIATCRQMGLRAVQLGTGLLDECLERPDRIGDVVARLDHEGVAIAALAGYRNLVAPDEKARRANLEFIARCLETAPLFGTSVVATEAGTRHPTEEWGDSPDNWRPESRALLEDALTELIPVAERAGSILALEASVKHVLRTAGQVLGVLERFPSRHLQVVCDPYNYLSSHLLAARQRISAGFLDRFEHRFVVAHLKDVDPGGAEVETGEFGTGVFPQRPYIDFLATRRPDLPLVIEHLPLEHVPAVASRVRELAPQYVSNTRSA